MNKFNLEKALAGEKVITRDGRPITQLVKFNTYSGSVLYGLDCDNDHIEQWLVDGRYHDTEDTCGGDLFMAPKKLNGFVNVYNTGEIGCIFNGKDECKTESKGMIAVACIDLSQFDEGHGL